MKWSDLTLKERKQIYDAVRAENPNASYFDIKSQFDSIPEYEDGKNRSRWLSDKAYRDSISTLQNSQRFKISKEFKSPTLEELRDDSSVGGNIGNSDGLFTVLDGLEALKTTPSITSEQIENATDSQYNSRINRLEPLKQYAKVGSIIGQAALGGGAIVARNAGNAALSSVLQGAGALWDGVEAIQAVNDGDFKSVIQNVVPIGAAGVASLKYAPKFKYTNNLVIDAAENIGPMWDFSVNPIIESTKDGKAPAYEDGGKKIVPPRELGLTPGTPEYYKRQQQISGRAELVQPEAYVTPVGYIKDAILPDKKTYELVKGIDTAYGTDYLDAYKRIAARDMTGRGKYIKYAELPGNKNAKISRVRDVQDYGPVVDDYVITIDPLQYLPGTANHELGHLADQLASDANNRYLTYLLDEGNIMGPGELRSKGINVGSDMQSYLLDPSESKSHMLHLKRALVNEGKIHDWSSKVNQMEFITPLLLPVAGYETNKE